eukprot:CAMPEP_0178430584 /NCGR_PEP_ID=MMETSP0689_2-20121128/31399_1 /TAXON_ID=160604 /ORGANISM="Amphidinium massartii, Strain CS-259" /LENGTH=81 /DNA_ID=CAMNT_0020052453 /DNA_START=29 /DNA_END=274 /DNA_ORIENTATION=-
MPDFNKPVSLGLGSEAQDGAHHSEMPLETLLKRFYGEPPEAPYSTKFKPDAKAWYETSVLVKFPEPKAKKRPKAKAKPAKA